MAFVVEPNHRILVCNSLPKSGSTWTFFCLRHALLELGGGDVLSDRESLGVRVSKGGNPGRVSEPLIRALLQANKTYVFKSHDEYRPEIDVYLSDGRLRMIYLIRHPFDIVVSALDHGSRDRAAHRSTSPYFSICSLEDALSFLVPYWGKAASWLEQAERHRVRIIRYEDMLSSPGVHIERILAYFFPESGTERIAAAARAGLAACDVQSDGSSQSLYTNDQLRYNQGRAGRHKERFNRAELDLLTARLGAVRDQLGYA